MKILPTVKRIATFPMTTLLSSLLMVAAAFTTTTTTRSITNKNNKFRPQEASKRNKSYVKNT